MTGVRSFLRQLVIGTHCDAQNNKLTRTVPLSNLGLCGVRPETSLLRFIQIICMILVVPHRELSVNIIRTNRYIIFREVIDFDCKNHTKYSINTSRGKMEKFLKWQKVVFILTTGLWKIKRVKTLLCLKARHQIFSGSWKSYYFNQLVQSGVRHFGNVNQPDSIPYQV
jgi:hypothetical protein